jgi:hypothetical protein
MAATQESASTFGWSTNRLRHALEQVRARLVACGLSKTQAAERIAKAVGRKTNTVVGWYSTHGFSRALPDWDVIDCLRYRTGIAIPASLLGEGVAQWPEASTTSAMGWPEQRLRATLSIVIERVIESGAANTRNEAAALIGRITGRAPNTIQGWISDGPSRDLPAWPLVDCLRYRTGLAVPVSILPATSADPEPKTATPARTRRRHAIKPARARPAGA